jgi:2'-deoxynucleoside 5'-phosphate N-hydrolase
MKIYFAGSIKGGREDTKIYTEIINYLKKFGEVLTEHIGDVNITSEGEEKTAEFIHDRDIKWINEADVVVAEVTTPSLGVGYELGRTVDTDKKVLCLFRNNSEKKLSAMVAGNKNFIVKNYSTIEDVKNILDQWFG